MIKLIIDQLILITLIKKNLYRRQWHLMVEEGYQVRIEWIDFEMENAWSGTKCKFDYAALVDAAGQVNFLWQTFFAFK